MAINKNHEFEELDGIKCAIVEKNVTPERVAFLQELLELNNFTVVVAASAPPKMPATPPKPAAIATSESEIPGAVTQPSSEPVPETPIPPATFTVGVTDVSFNPINAIFGRLLKTKEGNVVTLAYWHQKEKVAQDEIPYFENPLS